MRTPLGNRWGMLGLVANFKRPAGLQLIMLNLGRDKQGDVCQ